MPEQEFNIRPLIPARVVDLDAGIELDVVVGVVLIRSSVYVTGPTGFFSFPVAALEDVTGDTFRINPSSYSGGFCLVMNVEILRDALASLFKKKMKKPSSKRYCPQGHDTHDTGRNAYGKCMECKRERGRADRAARRRERVGTEAAR